jgi:outer membrane protein OmpA-like peptidoglycan-associated protein
MFIGKSPSFGACKRRTRWSLRALVTMVLLAGLAACNPIETWRDWTGASRNDPDPETTPNTKNLAAGETADYPNLATVPPPPVRALSAADREKLTQSLIADRTNARYSDEQLRAGASDAAGAPLPPPPPAAEASGGNSVSASLAEPSPSASEPAASTPPAAQGGASTTPAATAARHDKLVAGSASASPKSAEAGGKKLATAGRGLRKQGEPPEPGPMESSLDVPQARATPQPEPIKSPPPPPQLPPPPKLASTAQPLPGGLAAGGALAPVPLHEAKAAAGFEPAPPPPEVPPPAPTRAAAVQPSKTGEKPPEAAGTPVAEIRFTADAKSLSESDRKKLEAVVPLYQRNPGKIRVIGYAKPSSGAVEQLDNYRAALDHAQAVAAALSKAGVPSDKIQVEAAPTGAAAGESRAEVLLEH